MSTSIPGYKKIAGEITQRIHNGQYPSKSYLPSENKLAREFDVTRTTIRKALNILKQQGTIESFQGKGYRVKSLFWEQSLLHFYSFGRDIAENLLYPETDLISLQEISELKDVEEFNNQKLWEITRLRKMDEVPLILETSYIPVKLIPDIDAEALSQDSLYTILEENDIQIIKAKEYLEPVIPSLQVQKYLEINADNPLFQTVRHTFDNKQELVEVRESLIRGDHFRFTVEMTL